MPAKRNSRLPLRQQGLIGKRFGKRIVLDIAPPSRSASGKSQSKLIMLCDCGTQSVEGVSNIKSGRAQSCGCDIPFRIARSHRTHGYTVNRMVHPIYNSWSTMLTRCTNANNPSFKNYGGRGIRVCRRWMKFKNFESDMASSWFHKATLERKNNNGNYTKRNCCWITKGKQTLNTRRARKITFNGQTLNLQTWMERTGITSIAARLKAGYSIRIALTTPAGQLR